MSQQTGRIHITRLDIWDSRFIQILRIQIMFHNPRYFRIQQKITQQEVGLIDAEKRTRENGDQSEEPNGSGVRPNQSAHAFHARVLNEAGKLGKMIICHLMNITIRLLGGVSIFAKFHS